MRSITCTEKLNSGLTSAVCRRTHDGRKVGNSTQQVMVRKTARTGWQARQTGRPASPPAAHRGRAMWATAYADGSQPTHLQQARLKQQFLSLLPSALQLWQQRRGNGLHPCSSAHRDRSAAEARRAAALRQWPARECTGWWWWYVQRQLGHRVGEQLLCLRAAARSNSSRAGTHSPGLL